MVNLSGMNAEELEKLSARADQLAKALRKEEPSLELALANGVEDLSYKTVANGWVSSYRRTCEVTLANGTRWRGEGKGPTGDAWSIGRQGRVIWTRL